MTDDDGLTDSKLVTITVTDTPVTIMVTPATVTVDEAGGIATYDVSVSAVADGGTVTVAIASDDDDITLSHNELTFADTTPNTITVIGVNDDIDADRTTTITHTASGVGYDATAMVTVTLTDDDTAGFMVISPPPLAEGDSVTYTIKPTSEPSGLVTVAMTSADTMIATVTPAITFGPSDWDAKEITVSGVNDAIDSADRTTTISHEISGGGYDGVVVDDVTVTVTDDDVAGVTVSVNELTVDENGDAKTYTIKLNSEPTATVTVTPTANVDGVVTVSDAITFTTTTWNVMQNR